MQGMINGSRKLNHRILGFTATSPTIWTEFLLVACKAAFETQKVISNEPERLR
jgi:hypothetical protein